MQCTNVFEGIAKERRGRSSKQKWWVIHSLTKLALIDDVQMRWRNSWVGPPILFTNPEIRRMLNLAEAGKDDVFLDLGCGWAQNLIVAATEFGVEKCVGIESRRSRYLRAKERVERRSLSSHITIINGEFEDMFKGRLKGASPREATIVLYGLATTPSIIRHLSRTLGRRCKLLYYYHALFPEITPDAVDYPFYVSVFPFKRPVSELDWLCSVVRKQTSSYVPGAGPETDELWEELSHDYEVLGLKSDVAKYKARLLRSLRSNA